MGNLHQSLCIGTLWILGSINITHTFSTNPSLISVKPPSFRSNHPTYLGANGEKEQDTTKAAKAMTDYMVKAHEEKLKFVKNIEKQKETEIKALKKELDNMKEHRGTSSLELASSSIKSPITTTPNTPVVNGSMEDVTAKLASYQKFMSDYIIKATEQKLKAVKEAEIAISKKYEAKLLLSGGTSSGDESSSSSDKIQKTETNKVHKNFTERSAKVISAAAKGKSRWGDAEVQKAENHVKKEILKKDDASTSSSSSPTTSKTTTAEKPTETATSDSVLDQDIPDNVLEADKGLRADGGVGGLTLAERVLLGSNASSSTPPSTSTAATATVATRDTSSYDHRNSFIMKANKAGKNYRWGDLEVKHVLEYEEQKKALGSSSTNANTSAAVVKVEETNRNELKAKNGASVVDGLSDRINLGASILQQ